MFGANVSEYSAWSRRCRDHVFIERPRDRTDCTINIHNEDSNMKRIQIISAITALAAIPFITVASYAQPAPLTQQSMQFIRVTGEASVSSTPDEVSIDLGVTTQAATAQAAAAENASKVENVMAMVKKVAGENAAIRTIQYGLNPDYRQVREDNQPPMITSYSAYNMIRIRTTDLDRVGRIIDAAIGAGANTVQAVSFSIRETNNAHNQALSAATENAMAKAEAIASALTMRIQKIMSVEEGGGASPYPVYANRALESATMIEPGAVEVRATVTLTVEMSK